MEGVSEASSATDNAANRRLEVLPGVLPRAPMAVQRGRVVLTLPSDLAPLNSDRLQTRLRQFARLLGGDPEVRAAS